MVVCRAPERRGELQGFGFMVVGVSSLNRVLKGLTSLFKGLLSGLYYKGYHSGGYNHSACKARQLRVF